MDTRLAAVNASVGNFVIVIVWRNVAGRPELPKYFPVFMEMPLMQEPEYSRQQILTTVDGWHKLQEFRE